MKNSYTANKLPVFLAASCILHAIILSFAFFGLPSTPKTPPEEKVIVFELLQVSSVNNVKTKKIQKEPTIKNDDAKKIEKSKDAEPAQKEEEQKEKKKEIIEEPKKNAEPLPTKEKKPEEKKEKEKKKEESKKNPPKKEEKKLPPKKIASSDKELDSLLKNLEKESDGNNSRSNKVNREKSDAKSDAFGNYNDSSPESLTNDELIKQQIMKHWNQPVASATENISIAVKLLLAKDGTVERATIISAKCPNSREVLCSATKDSVIRAITNASPLVNLLPEDYSSWEEMTVTFDTRR